MIFNQIIQFSKKIMSYVKYEQTFSIAVFVTKIVAETVLKIKNSVLVI